MHTFPLPAPVDRPALGLKRGPVVLPVLPGIGLSSLGAFLAVAGDTGAPLWLVLGGFLATIVGGVVALRKMEPERAKINAEADRIEVESAQIEENIRTTLLASVHTDMARLRDELHLARANEASAQAEAATVRAEKAELLAATSIERHDYLEQIGILQAHNTRLTAQVQDLREKVETLEARLGITERRDDAERRAV